MVQVINCMRRHPILSQPRQHDMPRGHCSIVHKGYFMLVGASRLRMRLGMRRFHIEAAVVVTFWFTSNRVGFCEFGNDSNDLILCVVEFYLRGETREGEADGAMGGRFGDIHGQEDW